MSICLLFVFAPVYRPRPPSQLTYGMKAGGVNNMYRQLLGLNILPAYLYSRAPRDALTYRAKVTSQRRPDNRDTLWECTDPEIESERLVHSAGLDIPVQEIVMNTNDYSIFVRAATVVGGVESEYVWLFNESDNCEIPVKLGE